MRPDYQLYSTQLSRYSTSHVVHLLLSMLTLGAWTWVWIFKSCMNCSERNKLHKQYGQPIESNWAQAMLFVGAIILGLAALAGKSTDHHTNNTISSK